MNKVSDYWMSELKKNGSRPTPARRAIVDVVSASDRALEPMQVFILGRETHHNFGLVTVYRTLEKLEEIGLVQRVHDPAGCNLYMRASTSHEHLLICSSCGKTVFFSGDDLSSLITAIAGKTGYTITDHWLQLFGVCPVCTSKGSEN